MNNKAIVDDWRIKLLLPLLWFIDFLLKQRPIASAIFERVNQRETLKNILLSIYANKESVDETLVEIIREPANEEGALDAFVSIVTGPPGPNLVQLMPSISIPVLVLWGDQDPFTPLDGPVGKYFSSLPSKLSNVKLIVLEGVGHCPHDDRPELGSLKKWVTVRGAVLSRAPPTKRNLGHWMEADSYPIDYIACATTPTDLLKLRTLYNIPEEILLVIPGKDDVPSRPPRGYVMMHLESFKLGARLPLQRYFVEILGGMHLAPGQLHPNGWRVLSAMYVLWERCGSVEPSLVGVKHLYQLKSSLKEAGWYYFMSSSAKRKPITSFPSSCKNWKNKFFFAGGNWCPAARSLGGDIYLPMRFVIPESWGLIKELEDRPLLQVETALVNASTCQDLLSSTNLVRSRLVDVAAGMDNEILSAMTRKRGRAPSSSSNPPPPSKKTNVGPPKASVPALPPPPPQKNGGEKVSDKSPKMVKDIESMNLAELAGSVQRVSFKLATLVSCYKNRSLRHERRLQADNQDLKKKAESAGRSKEKLLDLHKQIMDLEEKVAMAESTSVKLESELGDLKFDLQATQSKGDTLKTTLEGEIKSLSEQLAEAKGKSADVDDRLDAEYDSRRNMAEADQGSKEQDDQDQVEAPLGGVQVEEAGDRAPEVGQGSVPPPPDVADLPLPEIADPSTVEAADPHNL
ncbi:hypothetical protein KPL70_008213 [Citrus sinensis]|nr:hypothetical protein KPL70_008213 [Citrus sinensis]